MILPTFREHALPNASKHCNHHSSSLESALFQNSAQYLNYYTPCIPAKMLSMRDGLLNGSQKVLNQGSSYPTGIFTAT